MKKEPDNKKLPFEKLLQQACEPLFNTLAQVFSTKGDVTLKEAKIGSSGVKHLGNYNR